MRTRTAIASVLIAAGILLGGASMASAAEPETGGAGVPRVDVQQLSGPSKEIYECVEEQSAKPAPQDFTSCAKAPSPILPAVNELLWGTLSFFVLLIVLAKFAYPPLKKGMENRAEKIRSDLDAADEARVAAESTLAQYQEKLATARGEATRIIEDARATADALKADLQKRAEADIAETRQRAAADVEAAKSQALADLRGEVAKLAIGAAEVVVQKSLDEATQVQLVENYINQVAASRN